MTTATTTPPPKRYEIPPVDGRGISGDWAIIVVDIGRGYFSAVSDRGNYAFKWPETGDAFVRLLLEMERDWDYLHGKLMFGRPNREVYDSEATLKSVTDAILALADPEDRKAERRLLADCDDLGSRHEFSRWCEDTEIGDAPECIRTSPEPDCLAFCKVIYPRFCALLKAELEAMAWAVWVTPKNTAHAPGWMKGTSGEVIRRSRAEAEATALHALSDVTAVACEFANGPPIGKGEER